MPVAQQQSSATQSGLSGGQCHTLMSSLAYGPALAMCCDCSAQGPVARASLLSALRTQLRGSPMASPALPCWSSSIPDYVVSALSLGHGDSLSRLSRPGWYPGTSLVSHNTACSGRVGSHDGSKLWVGRIGGWLGVWVAPRTKYFLSHSYRMKAKSSSR